MFGTKGNEHSENGQKQSQGNLKTVKLTQKQSYGTSQCTLKTAKKVVMGKLKTGKMFEKVKHQLWVFFFLKVMVYIVVRKTSLHQ